MELAPLLSTVVPVIGWTAHSTLLARRLARARRDPLTGLHTRDGFTARAEHLLRTRPGRALVLLIDLDDFKTTNDTHGHAAGDAVLKATAERLAHWTTTRHGIAARLGGDEFAAVVLDTDTTGSLRRLLATPVPHTGLELPVSASIGSTRPVGASVPLLGDALALADAAMYATKPGRSQRR